MRTPLYNAYDTFNRKSPVLHSADSNQEPKGGIPMNDQELFKQVLKWSYHHCPNLWKEYYFNAKPEKRKQIARKILIEKVKKEPDTELLISPALKEKILLKEGVDLKRLNQEYQEKKGSFKVKQETKIYNQKPCTDREDSDVDEDEIKNLHLSEHFSQEWNKVKWYSLSAIASKLGIHRKTVVYWRDIGIKINGAPIRLKMIKRPHQWYSKGKWIIEFFLKTNADVDMDGT
jgi:hypothetical protein